MKESEFDANNWLSKDPIESRDNTIKRTAREGIMNEHKPITDDDSTAQTVGEEGDPSTWEIVK